MGMGNGDMGDLKKLRRAQREANRTRNNRPWEHPFLYELSEEELKRIMNRPGLPYIEWQFAGQVYFRSDEDLAIVRTHAGGGDTQFIDGGWKYFNKESLERAWSEIVKLPDGV